MKYLYSSSVNYIKQIHPYITDMFFEDIEKLIQLKIDEKILNQKNLNEEIIEKSKNSNFVINALTYYVDHNLKKMDIKEFDFFCSNLSNYELEKVLKFMEDNGGYYKFIEL